MTRPLSKEELEAVAGAEILLLEGEEFVREGLRKLLASAGLLVTATGESSKALDLVGQKHFAVSIIDADTPGADEGVRLLQQLKAASPATAFVLLAVRQTFDVAVRGFRAGAADVVAKSAESVTGLLDRVVTLCREVRRGEERDLLLRETVEVHEQFLKRLMDASRKVHQAEEVARGQSGTVELDECVVLVVDGNPRTAEGLQAALGKGASYRCVSATSGGEALDYAGQHRFQIALVNERLPDLPWTMVTKGLRGQVKDSIVLAFSNPSQEAGHVVIIEEHSSIELVAELMRGEQLVEAIHKMREGYIAKTRERRYLQAFRSEHYDFLKRYVELKQKLAALGPRGK